MQEHEWPEKHNKGRMKRNVEGPIAMPGRERKGVNKKRKEAEI
jgi:hypothetical protein